MPDYKLVCIDANNLSWQYLLFDVKFIYEQAKILLGLGVYDFKMLVN